MRKYNKNKIDKKYLFIIIIVIIIILLVILSYTLKKDRQLTKIEGLIKDSITFTSKIIMTPFDYIINVIDDYKELKEVKKENDLLKTSIERIDSIETENIELRKQLKNLQEELNIDYSLTDYEYLNATVTSRNINYWYNTITLDKGSYSGVSTDMVVINATGLIGKVISTTTFTSTVRMITTSDTNNKISVSIITNGNKLNGLINKYDYNTNTLEVEGISNTETVMVNDIVYTSGLGGIFPSGILIGTVESITTDEYDLAKIIKVKPSANFEDINYVSILKRKSEVK